MQFGSAHGPVLVRGSEEGQALLSRPDRSRQESIFTAAARKSAVPLATGGVASFTAFHSRKRETVNVFMFEQVLQRIAVTFNSAKSDRKILSRPSQPLILWHVSNHLVLESSKQLIGQHIMACILNLQQKLLRLALALI